MILHIQSLKTQKQGLDFLEYEDAVLPSCEVKSSFSGENFRCAMADGATESSFSREWAEALTRVFCRGELEDESTCASCVQTAQTKWLAHVERRIAGKPWFVAEKAANGAFAAFVGLRLHADGKWDALAMGDSCLFLVRDQCLAKTWPLEKAEQFNSSPTLLSTRSQRLEEELAGIQKSSGTWQEGDRFFLATDALSQWFLQEHECESRPWEVLKQILDGDSKVPSFQKWVDGERAQGALKNDDTTLLCVRVMAAADAAVPALESGYAEEQVEPAIIEPETPSISMAPMPVVELPPRPDTSVKSEPIVGVPLDRSPMVVFGSEPWRMRMAILPVAILILASALALVLVWLRQGVSQLDNSQIPQPQPEQQPATAVTQLEKTPEQEKASAKVNVAPTAPQKPVPKPALPTVSTPVHPDKAKGKAQ